MKAVWNGAIPAQSSITVLVKATTLCSRMPFGRRMALKALREWYAP